MVRAGRFCWVFTIDTIHTNIAPSSTCYKEIQSTILGPVECGLTFPVAGFVWKRRSDIAPGGDNKTTAQWSMSRMKLCDL
jgi:hypothetical protein